MASTSKSTPDDLLGQICRLYDLKATGERVVTRSVNDTYRLRVDGGDVFLRVYGLNPYYPISRESLLFELELLVHFADCGIGVSRPLRNREGGLLTEVELVGQRRQAAVFPEVAGAPHRAWWPRIEDDESVRRLGELLARMHSAADDFSTNRPRYSFDLQYLLEEPLRLLRLRLTAHHRSDETAFFSSTAQKARDSVSRLGKGPGTYGVIHGDAHVGNVFYDASVGFTLIDFDHCAYGWRVWDLVPLLNTLHMNVPDAAVVERVWSLVIGGYEAVRSLSGAERAAIPAFQVLWHCWDIGEMLVLSSVWGGPIDQGEGLDVQMAYLDEAVRRLEDCKRWYESRMRGDEPDDSAPACKAPATVER